ncbi:2-oxo-4-hydroxy-4-carboxy-5-ureidoimidazoline decarboxylase [Tatumella sp. TA1]|uniref:2-oxo-4-hydroxy-4-carboxy-5-ureidoimidazoline decarboxylase n=1 Tax=Rosenbergiella collisarenosi TaxID=1544695 RepID=UPI0008F8EFF1|nr:2-oxo-4-hydroxy-4-carboxy-5-ureidoimidazoline decarboxylase [Rosenbergiella collisarenosi]MBT0722660.1 2-oxo-4-hydroxy-4-carboxy-5-ureidoimidazoline decarboxylase [Rosenbergiella collisarenosi]QGX92163.1 2-oxo-4-hydroxy-4-carboxy-5-ureidoimidazoline decarboxylase [Tatumella sp. TA1]
MLSLKQFNNSDNDAAQQAIAHCVALANWQQQLVAHRPFCDSAQLYSVAHELTLGWGEDELLLALSAHPRIGEKPEGATSEAQASRREQAAVQESDYQSREAIRVGNQRYEQRFHRVFLIRAKGRSPTDILNALTERLCLSDAEDIEVSLEQLREITLLRLQEAIQ